MLEGTTWTLMLGRSDNGGRGLLIVAALADSWEITPTTAASHRTATFELALP